MIGEFLTLCLSLYQSISCCLPLHCKMRSLSVLPAIQLSPGHIITKPPVSSKASDWQFVGRFWFFVESAESIYRRIKCSFDYLSQSSTFPFVYFIVFLSSSCSAQRLFKSIYMCVCQWCVCSILSLENSALQTVCPLKVLRHKHN